MIATGAAAAVAGAAGSTLSLSVSPSVVSYGNPVHIQGKISSGHKGVTVTLERRAWPFTTPFTSLGSQSTKPGGSYDFTAYPSVATRYRVVVSGATSPTEGVHVVTNYALASCGYSNSAHHYNTCTDNRTIAPGTYTLSFSFDLSYPPTVYAQESAKRAFVYYGERDSNPQANPPPPRSLRYREKVSQTPLSAGTTRVSATLTVTVPSYWAWAWSAAVCTQTSYQSDGFGLAGTPGSHGCGGPTITYAQSKGPLG